MNRKCGFVIIRYSYYDYSGIKKSFWEMLNLAKQNIIIHHLSSYQPKMIGIFGSYARNTQTKSSDIDILIDLKKKISLLDLVGIEMELTKLLGIKVDLVTKGALKNKKLIGYINKDLKVILG